MVVLVGLGLGVTASAARAEEHKQVCGKSDVTVRALMVGKRFAGYKWYGVTPAERIDCKSMPKKKSNVPKNILTAIGETYSKLQGTWLLGETTTEVDKNDLHTYKYVTATFYSDELGVQTREGNSAEEVSEFPTSKHPEDDAAVLAGIKAKPGDAFSDKDVRKVSVISDWEDAGKQGGVWRKRAQVVVGVFDSENKKCWTWNKITVIRPEKGKPEVEEVGVGVNEIDCKNLK